jgi:4-hydroxy-tetrahydrodipicolinate reductase
MMRLAVVGASGRMGRAVVRLAQASGEFTVVCAVAAADVGRDVGELAGIGPIGVRVVADVGALRTAGANVAIDFSSPEATASLAVVAAATRCALVSGTTGLGADVRDALDRAADQVPVLWEPNMSPGVHVLTELVRRAVTALADWDIEIVETHHRAKVDAPSGTAVRLAETAQRARTHGTRLVHGRQGRPGAREDDEIGLHAVRGGDVLGDHVVHLLGAGERLELAHRATSRDVFAHGAIRAARWIADRPPGRYTLSDALNAAR